MVRPLYHIHVRVWGLGFRVEGFVIGIPIARMTMLGDLYRGPLLMKGATCKASTKNTSLKPLEEKGPKPVYIWVILGLYRENGKENGTYYLV